jgi:hypothetical protein
VILFPDMPPNSSPLGPETVSASGSALPVQQSNLFLIIGAAVLLILVITAIGYFLVPKGLVVDPAIAVENAQDPAVGTALGASAYANVADQANPLNAAPVVNPFDTDTPPANPFVSEL